MPQAVDAMGQGQEQSTPQLAWPWLSLAGAVLAARQWCSYHQCIAQQPRTPMTKEKGLEQALGFVPQAVLWVMSQWRPRSQCQQSQCQPPSPSLFHVECKVPGPCASSIWQPGPRGSSAAVP